MRLPAILVALAVVCWSAATKPPAAAKAEAQLRARVEAFYKLAVDKKFRQMEAMVAPESREEYYAGDKPEILDFHVDAIQWLDGGKQANVTMVSKVLTRHIKSGDQIDAVPYASHWKLIDGVWYWHIPHVSRRVTSFGPMHTDPEKAARSHMDLKEMIRKGPDMEQLMNGVQAPADHLELDSKTGATATMVLTNKLPGTVELALAGPIGVGFTATLSAETLKAGEQATLTVTSGQGLQRDASVGIQVRPTGQNLVIQVNFRKPAK